MARMNYQKAAKRFLDWRRSRDLPDTPEISGQARYRTPRGDHLAVSAARAERRWLRQLPPELQQAIDPKHRRPKRRR
jgi:hypothetical protein